MAARKGTTQITEQIFNAVKILIESGEKKGSIAEYMNIAPSSITRIAKSETYEEYKQEVSAYYFAKKKAATKQEPEKKEPEKVEQVQVVEHRQTVTVQATHYMMEEMKAQTELLKTISAKLAFIVEQLA